MSQCKTCGTEAVGLEYTWIIATGRCGICHVDAENLMKFAHNLRTLVVVNP